MKLAELKPDTRNANRGTDRGRKLIQKSLKSYGAGRSILIDKNGHIIAGNKTAEGAKAAGLEDVQVVQTDGSRLVAVQRTDLDINDKTARELAIADNRASEVSLEWDPNVLADFEKELSLETFWSPTELEQLLAEVRGEKEAPEPQIDKAAELQQKWGTARGQIWEIGKHRLMCGDSGAQYDVAALFRESKAWMLCTDPPYGVAYGVGSGPDSAKRFTAIDSDVNNGPKLQSFLEQVFRSALPYLESGASWYLWHAQMTQGFFAAAAAAAAAHVKIHRQIIWAKSHFILGHGDYHWQHELCFYGWREGEKRRWFGGRDKSTLWNIDNPRAHENHPTEKPPELFERAMIASTNLGEIVYEPFAGSGSQYSAAERMARVCYGMEIEPKYVAVSLQRLSDMGLKPVKVHG